MTAVGIASNTVKQQRLLEMDMQFMWVGDKVPQEMYELIWHPGQENLADYQSKHHVGAHHANVHRTICTWITCRDFFREL